MRQTNIGWNPTEMALRSRKLNQTAGHAEETYKIPRTAPEALRPYVDLLTKLDVAGVDPSGGRLGLLLIWLSDDIQATVDTELVSFNISEKKLDVLMLLLLAESEEHGESLLSPSAISDYFGVSRTTVTGLLDFLERRKLVRRMHHPVDRRRIQTILTPAGRLLVTRAAPVFWRACAALTEPLDARDKEDLERVMGKIYANMKSQFDAKHHSEADAASNTGAKRKRRTSGE
ncbi:DNA-binding MarR family transcriptional regulator [Xanthobacter flavus]|uniref:DNA-binding MarR family transcriptional regulator n=2 Tax=Xanthobacter flavus TaxID=281 RepID=A0ABU1KLQ5_XANFL|nr:MarR family transcriptional regulator [Xanthobacter flavus]MBN8918105.1 MarR family transcriptional regulator [Hyphomicrobiales bacterium]MDR6335526.1 DNA-binding MarR family transcriptional regulator [Xanthobacter flavus]